MSLLSKAIEVEVGGKILLYFTDLLFIMCFRDRLSS